MDLLSLLLTLPQKPEKPLLQLLHVPRNPSRGLLSDPDPSSLLFTLQIDQNLEDH